MVLESIAITHKPTEIWNVPRGESWVALRCRTWVLSSMARECLEVDANVVSPVELRCGKVVGRGIVDIVCSYDYRQSKAMLLVGDDRLEQKIHSEMRRVHVDDIEVDIARSLTRVRSHPIVVACSS